MCSRVSIIQDGLVGGMFLTFLLDTFAKCKDETFINVFMLVGILHYVSNNLSMLYVYGRRAVAVTNTFVFRLLQHLVKLAMFPSLVWLAWFVLKFNTEIDGVWTFEEELVVEDMAGDCTPCYCDVMYVRLAELVVAFQVLMGAARLLVWATLWYIGPQVRHYMTMLAFFMDTWLHWLGFYRRFDVMKSSRTIPRRAKGGRGRAQSSCQPRSGP